MTGIYQSGVSLVYIRDILGHMDISTIDIYARLWKTRIRILHQRYYQTGIMMKIYLDS